MTDSRTGEFNREKLREAEERNRKRSAAEDEPTRYWNTGPASPEDTFYQPVDYSYAEYPGEIDADGVYHTAADTAEEAGWDSGYDDGSGQEPEGSSYGFHDIPRKRRKHRKKHILLRLMIVLAVVLALLGFLMSGVFSIDRYEVEGNHYYSDQEILNIANATTGVNIFDRSNVKTIRSRLLANPYFTEVKIRRKLPATMVIRVKEKRQAAAFVYGDSYIVIDRNGVVLRKTNVEPQITLLRGFHLSRIDVGKKVRVEETSMLEQTLDMLESTRKGDFYFKQINASEVMVKGYVTDSLLVKGSPKQVKKVIDSGDLQKVVSKLFQNGTKRGTLSVGEENYISFSPDI